MKRPPPRCSLRIRAAGAAALALGLLALPGAAGAQILLEGDVLVGDNATGEVLKIDLGAPPTANQTPVPTGAPITNLRALSVDARGRIYASSNPPGLTHRLFAVLPDLQLLVLLRSGIFFRGVAARNDAVCFASELTNLPRNAVLRGINSSSVTEELAGARGHLIVPQGIALAPDGTLLVADPNGTTRNEDDPVLTGRGVFEVDPEVDPGPDGLDNQRVIAQDGFFGQPWGVEVTPDGNTLYVADRGGERADESIAPGQIVVVDATLAFDPGDPAANQSVLTSGGLLLRPRDLALLPDGSLLVADSGAELLVRVDTTTGAQTVASQGQGFDAPYAVEIVPPQGLPRPAFFVSEGNRVLRIDPEAPAGTRQSEIAAGGLLVAPGPLVLEGAGGDLLVADGDRILRVTRAGAVSVVSSGGLLDEPVGLALDAEGMLLVTNFAGGVEEAGTLIAVDPASGAQELLIVDFTAPSALALGALGLITLVANVEATPMGGEPVIAPALIEINPTTRIGVVVVSQGGGPAFSPANPTNAAATDADHTVVLVGTGEAGGETIGVAARHITGSAFQGLAASGEILVPRAVGVDLTSRDLLVLDDIDPAVDGDEEVRAVDPISGRATPVPTDGFAARARGLAVDQFVPPPVWSDTDLDGVHDLEDNCLGLFNPDQRDSTNAGAGDGVGNACDADYDNDGVVEISDFLLFSNAFPSQPGDPGYDPDIDPADDPAALEGNEISAFNLLASQFGGPPGPSGRCDGSDPACPQP